MAWALVTTESMTLGMWQINVDAANNPQLPSTVWNSSVSIASGTIAALIEYDGISDYTPEAGFKLESVPDNAQIGDTGY